MQRIFGTMLILGLLLVTQARLCAEDNAAASDLAAKEKKAVPPKVQLSAPGTPVQSLETSLAQKVTCEFVDSPTTEVFAFLRSLKNMNIVVSPAAQSSIEKVSLKVVDMSINDVLKYVCKLANLTMEVQDQAIYIASADEGPRKAERKDPPMEPGAKVRIKLGNGNELEADASIFDSKPELLDKLVERFLQ